MIAGRVLLLAGCVAAGCAFRFDPTAAHACANASAMIDPFVVENWDIELMEGTFYEIAYHDYTQPRKLCGCERSVKTVNTTDEPATIADLFTLKCPPDLGQDEGDYITHLAFTETEDPGVLEGRCLFFAAFGTTVCPDYVIDVGTRDPGEPYPWVLEFQCVERRTGDLLFAGINFYSKDTSNETLTAMIDSAIAHGLGPFIEGGHPSGLNIVDHSNCTYPPVDA